MEKITDLVRQLNSDTQKIGYQALQKLIEMSKESNQVYAFFDEFVLLLDSENSLARNRGIHLIAENARWDVDHKIDESIDQYLKHLQDPKPITVRQCV